MLYCSWDMCVTDVIVIFLLDYFLPFTPLTARKMKISKKWKNPWRCHHFKQVYQKLWSYGIHYWDTVHDRYNCYFLFWAIFFPFTPLTWPKNKDFEKMKKTSGDIILQNCIKNHDHMLYCSWDMACDGCNCYFSFWAILCPFTPPNSPKTQNFTKMKKNTWRYHHFTHAYQKFWLDDVRFLRNGVQ